MASAHSFLHRSSGTGKSSDMLSGSLWNKLLLFALPVAASSSLQQLFNSADTAVVGRFAGSNALAAVGANGSIINLLLNLFIGLSVGTNVVLSQKLGQGDSEGASRTVHSSMVLAVGSGLILMVIGLVLAHPILTWMGTPEEILDMAVTYFRIYFAGMPFIMLYNFEAAILRSKGDTKRPLIVLTLAGILNLILNLIFVICFHMNVAGVALATVLSNVLSSLILLVLLLKEEFPLKVTLSSLRLSPKETGAIASIGMPAGMQGMMFSIANVIIQTAVNSLGSSAIAGSQAGMNAEYFAYFIITGFAQAAITFIGQNRGAGQFDRCRRSFLLCMGMGTIFVYLYVGLLLLLAHPFVSIFTVDPVVMEPALQRIFVILPFEFFNMCIEIISGAIRGYGKSLLPSLICVIGICVFRVIWVYTAFRTSQSYTLLMAAYPISWVITTAGLIAAYFFARRQVEKNR